MKAKIKNIELKKLVNRYYLKIKIESQGKIYVISNPLLSDPINFRKQVFGILSACNCYDIMKLATENPICQEIKGYYVEGKGYRILENKNGQWLLLNQKTGRYTCQKADEQTRQLIRKAQEHNISNVTINDGTVESIKSQSGTFQILFQSKDSGASFFSTGQIYYGFGYPINIGNNAQEDQKLEAAKGFTSFIVSIMKFYKENDLLKLGGNVEQYPEVEITLDNSNKINSITNETTGLGLIIGETYNISDPSKSNNYKEIDPR